MTEQNLRMLGRRFPARVPLLAALAFVVAATSSAAASPDAPTPDEVCALLTSAEATALVGKPAQAKPGSVSHGSSTCIWSDGGNSGMQVMIETDALHKMSSSSRTPPTATHRFKEMRDLIAKGKARAVPGVGDKAVWHTAFHVLWVLKGKKVAVVSVVRQRSPADDLRGARAIAAKILPRL